MLTTLNNEADWVDLKSNEYAFFGKYQGDGLIGIVFKCPGCNEPIAVSKPIWNINFEKLTATPSIKHDKGKGGCGWHGYLTDGELSGKVE